MPTKRNCSQEGCAAVLYGPTPPEWTERGKDLLCPQHAAQAVWFEAVGDHQLTRCIAPACTATIDSAPLPSSGWRITSAGAICPGHRREQDARDIERERLPVTDDEWPTEGGE